LGDVLNGETKSRPDAWPGIRGRAEETARYGTEGFTLDSSWSVRDLFLVLVARDGDEARAAAAKARESEHPGRLFVCLAIEEIEVWMLAIHSETLGTGWREIRAEIHSKDRFAKPFLQERAPKLDTGEGRAWAMRGLGGQWRGVLQRCPELDDLKRRVEVWLDAPR
jgi:hypothetical protein